MTTGQTARLPFWKSQSAWKDYSFLALITVGIGLLLMIVLPSLGIPQFEIFTSPLFYFVLLLGGWGAIAYWRYVQFTQKHIVGFFVFYTTGIDLVTFILKTFQEHLNISMRISSFEILIFSLPMLYIIFKTIKRDYWRMPLQIYLTLFFFVTLIYYFTFNQYAVDLLYKVDNQYTPLYWTRLISVGETCLPMLACWGILDKLVQPEKFFNYYMKYYSFFILIISFVAIAFFPFGILTQVIETKRMALIFVHPNAYALFMSLAVPSILGYGFYLISTDHTKKAFMYFSFLPVILIAMLLGGSKTSIVGIVASLAVIFLLEAFVNKRYRILLQNQKLLAVTVSSLIIFVVVLFSTGIAESVTTRLSNDGSLTWRYTQWQRLTSNMQDDTLIFGHGHTAAINRTQKFVYNPWNMSKNIQESNYIHNALLEHVYDYGVFGLLWLIGLLHCAFINIKSLTIPTLSTRLKSIHIACLGLIVLLLFKLLFDEAFYLPSPLAFWALYPILFITATRSQNNTPQQINLAIQG